jgi:hypothetical protein
MGLLIHLVISVACAAFVYSDATKRGMNAIGWGIGALILWFIFLPAYLIMRKPVMAGPVGMPVSPGYIPPPPPPLGTYAPPGTYAQPMPPQPTPLTVASPAGTAYFCTQCGHRYDGTMKFCPNCGAAQP